MRSPRPLRTALAAAALLASATTISAQAPAPLVHDSARAAAGAWIGGGAIGLPTGGGEVAPELFTIAAQWTYVRPGHLGGDFSLGTMPRVLAEGLAAAGLRAGVTLPIPLGPRALLLPA